MMSVPSSITASEVPDLENGEAVGDTSGQDTQGIVGSAYKGDRLCNIGS